MYGGRIWILVSANPASSDPASNTMANDLGIGFCCKPVINIRLPDVSEWDETTCPQLVCQHPHCWATVQRLQRGHPRILQPVSRAPKKSEDGLPTLKIVDLSLPDSSILAKRITDSSQFFKHPTSLMGDSKFDSDFQSSLEGPHFLGFKSFRDFRGQGFAQKPRKPVKLPVLNLNATHLPKYPDGGNLVMVWIPDEQGKHKKPDQNQRTNLLRMSPDKKSFIPLKISKIIPCQEWSSRRAAQKKKKSTHVPTGGQPCSAQLMHRWLKVPPPSPVTPPSYLESLPSWTFTVPKHSLISSLSDEERTILRMDQLDIISEESLFRKGHQFRLSKTKMILAVHRIKLQSPVLRYPANIRELHSRMPKATPKLKRKGPKITAKETDKIDRKPSLSKSEILQPSEMELKEESKKSKELLELHRVSFSDIFLPQKDSFISLSEDSITEQTQLYELEAQEVEPKETSKSFLAMHENLKEESPHPIQIPQTSDEQEEELLTPPSSRE
ncbi:uncharacterized protein C9orf43 homolog [Dromiciops gliroides]|uniref:uncharacterized protein C9orf43 homolog n=1 Tax=Dromiciops gliroides TaxID=33562 RepID=UPI001CC4ECFD|nr:uncharacterized protein C9orf43 homolog [Dromiciops gliroides]